MTQLPTAQIFHAPAKLNLFLHIVGRRTDGYHLLQSAFQLIDWCDEIRITPTTDGVITLLNPQPSVPAEQDLVVRAARLLQQHTGCTSGAQIHLEKRLPLGGGVGGGSSDAATTLRALNDLWQTGLSVPQLQALSVQLGADVPFFLFGQNAFVEGIGEQMQALMIPPRWYLLWVPPVHVPTAAIFTAPELVRDTPAINISQAQFAYMTNKLIFGRNDLQAVAEKQFPEISAALTTLRQIQPNGLVRMSGSGATIFAEFAQEEVAQAALQAMLRSGLPQRGYAVVRGLIG